jgi:hypothetical protein
MSGMAAYRCTVMPLIGALDRADVPKQVAVARRNQCLLFDNEPFGT